MSVIGWMAATGGLLLFMALSSAYVQRLPVSTSAIYLGVGVLVGPAGFGVVHIDLARDGAWFETLTQIALIVSLFVGGLKLRLPLRHPSWLPAVRLAGPVMIASIAGTALLAWWILGLAPALALLLAAILAPTDPVLASAVSVNDAEDHDRVRYALSGEAGFNDGAAYPFVVLALEAMRHTAAGPWLVEWFAVRLLWAIPVGLGVGYFVGRALGRVAIRLITRHRDTGAPSDFLALAVIALSYVIAEQLHGLGFLAAFAAGIGMRHAEVRVITETPHPSAWRRRGREWLERARATGRLPQLHPPAETLVPPTVDQRALEQPAVAAGVLMSETLTFGDTMERLLEVLLVVLVGIMLVDVWSPRAVAIALLLFVVVRPLSTQLLLIGTRTSRAQRWLLGWFGIRGIGGLYYVSYALNHAPSSDAVAMLVGPTITVIACSILIHGTTVTPIVDWFERRREPREGRGETEQRQG